MLRNLAAALLATTLVAGPAFAAQQSGNTGNTGGMAAPPATVSNDAKAAATSTQPAKHLRKHVRSHTRKHVAHRTIHRTKTVHHFTGSKPHKAYAARITDGTKGRKAAGAQPTQVPATRTN
jgi:outer membrane murein-binding lipoprotein Lpp